MKVKMSKAARMVISAIKAGTVPMIHGSPGIGKSELCHQIAKDHGLFLIDLRLSQCDPTDLAGFPQIDQARQKAGYLPMDTFPLEGEYLPAGYNGWLLFFDEANSAPKAVQAAAYKIILDRKVGQKKLHKHCALVAAGNLESDGAIVEPMSTALQSRMAPHFELIVDNGEWLEWAYTSGIHHRITDFIKFKSSVLYTFSADHTDHTYACPRTWAFANKLYKTTEDQDILETLAGTLSEGVAREFLVFCKIYDKLITPAMILIDPDTAKVPDEPSILFALTGSLAESITEDNAAGLMKYIARIPAEFQVVCLREVVRKHKELLKHPAVVNWVTNSAAKLF
jgi:hypothetical protein